MRWQINLPSILQIIQNRIKILLRADPPQCRHARTMHMPIPIPGDGGPVVRDGEPLEVERRVVVVRAEVGDGLLRVGGVDGGRVVDYAHPSVGRGGFVLEIVEGIHSSFRSGFLCVRSLCCLLF